VQRAPSVTRRLLLSVAGSLLLFQALTSIGIDYLYRDQITSSLQDLLEQELVALVSAAEPSSGGIDVRLLDPESRLADLHSGHYAAIYSGAGLLLWGSPSLAGASIWPHAAVAVGARELESMRLADGTTVRLLSRGLRWDQEPGVSRDLIISVAESTAPYEAMQRRFRQTIVAWSALYMALLVAAMTWLIRRTLAPLRRMEKEIGAIETGAREQLGEDYPRELAGAAQNLNTLLRSERQRSGRYRDTLGNLAHELKTPLAVARQALRSEPSPQASVNHEIDRMTGIIDRQLARAATGGVSVLGRAAVAVAPLVRDLRASMLKVHAGKDIGIELQIDEAAGFVGEAGDLTEVLGNLLDNACKWCRQRVVVESRMQVGVAGAGEPAQVLEFYVCDDGPGVAPEDRDRILERGARTDERMPGHGLGLAIVRDMVTGYGGSIDIESASTLGGARIRLRLPGRTITPPAW
jgi:two-component system sensor histidine kinase PhoQ